VTLLHAPAASQRAFNLPTTVRSDFHNLVHIAHLARTSLCLSLSLSLFSSRLWFSVSDRALFLQRRDQVRRTLESVRIFFSRQRRRGI